MHRPSDPLGVRTGARFVMSRARNVAINPAAVKRVGDAIAGSARPGNDWIAQHLGQGRLSAADLANYVLVLDGLNFCFWGDPRWRVTVPPQTHNGYWALAASLRRAMEEGYPITDAAYLARIPTQDVAMILRGESVIPLFADRVANLREVGQGLLRDYDGSMLNLIQQAKGSTDDLLRRVVTTFPSFVDVAVYQSRTIPFYKRAQILVSDLAGALAEATAGQLHDLQSLTAFADYKVPQVLQQLGVLRYSPDLIGRLSRHETIASGSEMEIEIRAATVFAVEQIAAHLSNQGLAISDYQVDWYLWDLGQRPGADILPYHRTPTSAY